MNTELPQDDQNEEQAAAEQTPAEESSPAVEETVVESIEIVETVEVEAVEAEVVEETPATETEAVETTPQLTLGDGAEDAGADSEEEAEEKPYVEPKIRGRIDKFGTAMGTGRRKTSVARVRIKDGTGQFVVNGRPLEDYFCLERDQKMIKAPLKALEELGNVDVWVRVNGGGITGQTGAVVLGIARAMQVKNPANHSTLSEGGYLTRDGRMVERKKYGLAKARKSFQFSKR